MIVRPIENMVNHQTNELFFDNLEIPAENLIGEEGKGFKYIMTGLNAERALIAAECIGDGYWFIDRVSKYANERQVFGRPIGQNQGVQFPIAEAFIEIEGSNRCDTSPVRCSIKVSRVALKPIWRNISRPRPLGKQACMHSISWWLWFRL